MKERLTLTRVKQAAKVLRCISHPDRLRIVESLEHQKLSVGQLVKKLGLSQVAVSKHLASLKQCGIVESSADKNFRYYTVIYPNVLRVLDCIRSHGGK